MEEPNTWAHKSSWHQPLVSAKPEGGEGLASSKNLQVLGRHQLVMALGHAMRLAIFIY
jgi:hypothetical protein